MLVLYFEENQVLKMQVMLIMLFGLELTTMIKATINMIINTILLTVDHDDFATSTLSSS